MASKEQRLPRLLGRQLDFAHSDDSAVRVVKMDVFWTTLIGIGGIVEIIALATGHPEWTLSEFVWRICKVTPGQPIMKWTAAHVLFMLSFFWLFFHFNFRVWR